MAARAVTQKMGCHCRSQDGINTIKQWKENNLSNTEEFFESLFPGENQRDEQKASQHLAGPG